MKPSDLNERQRDKGDIIRPEQPKISSKKSWWERIGQPALATVIVSSFIAVAIYFAKNGNQTAGLTSQEQMQTGSEETVIAEKQTESEQLAEQPLPETVTVKVADGNGDSIAFKMILVKKGKFTMGARTRHDSVNEIEFPTREITLTKDYYIAETEVTQRLWRVLTGKSPSIFKNDNGPVEGIMWNEAVGFTERLSELTGRRFRLPTEAEWEYAARGGHKGGNHVYSGSDNPDDVAWYYRTSKIYTHSVKTKAPNELGIYDMSGNVSEYCSDFYAPYDSTDLVDPKGPSVGNKKVVRGGDYYSDKEYVTNSSRWDVDLREQEKNYCNYIAGVRLVMDTGNTENSSQ